MKKQVQDTGVRKWFGDDWINLQDELYKAIETGLLAGGTGIVSGVQRTLSGGNYTFSEGIVMIDGHLHSFAGHTSANATIYIVPSIQHDTREYLQGGSKNITDIYETSVEYTVPVGSYIKADNTTKNRYFILKTDANNTFEDGFKDIVNTFVGQKYNLYEPTAWQDIPGAMYETPHSLLGKPQYMKDTLGYYHLKGYWNGSWMTLPTPPEQFIDFINLPKDTSSNITALEVLNDGTISQHVIKPGGVGKMAITHNGQMSIKLDLSTIPPFK
ncbi:MAG TPA: hypothetical protein PLP27_05635 [Crocinitomicaceae bacterium]|nr:hypothetical protein [Crocinitomicaceae bacterium]